MGVNFRLLLFQVGHKTNKKKQNKQIAMTVQQLHAQWRISMWLHVQHLRVSVSSLSDTRESCTMVALQLTEAHPGAAQTQMWLGNTLREMRDFALHLAHCIQGPLAAVPQVQASQWIVK